MATHVAAKTMTVEAASADGVDPLDDLRAGWQTQIDFGVDNPTLFALLSDTSRGQRSAAAQSGRQAKTTRKYKMHHHQRELETIIERLIAEQEGICALTSLPGSVRPTLTASLPTTRSGGMPAARMAPRSRSRSRFERRLPSGATSKGTWPHAGGS